MNSTNQFSNFNYHLASFGPNDTQNFAMTNTNISNENAQNIDELNKPNEGRFMIPMPSNSNFKKGDIFS